jgi:hypothetical protein
MKKKEHQAKPPREQVDTLGSIHHTVSSAVSIITSHYLTHSSRQDNAISPKRRYCETNEKKT